jgi:hypothetical protein
MCLLCYIYVLTTLWNWDTKSRHRQGAPDQVHNCPKLLQFRPLAIFKFLPSLPFHIPHLPSMQDQVVEQLEQL